MSPKQIEEKSGKKRDFCKTDCFGKIFSCPRSPHLLDEELVELRRVQVAAILDLTLGLGADHLGALGHIFRVEQVGHLARV